jgi:hypothetical protein
MLFFNYTVWKHTLPVLRGKKCFAFTMPCSAIEAQEGLEAKE